MYWLFICLLSFILMLWLINFFIYLFDCNLFFCSVIYSPYFWRLRTHGREDRSGLTDAVAESRWPIVLGYFCNNIKTSSRLFCHLIKVILKELIIYCLLGGVFKVRWQAICDLSFESTSHLVNSYNEGKPIKRSRDGQVWNSILFLQYLLLKDLFISFVHYLPICW